MGRTCSTARSTTSWSARSGSAADIGEVSRRQLLDSAARLGAATLLAGLLDACSSAHSSGSSSDSATRGGPTLRQVIGSAQQVQLALAQSANATGHDSLSFGLLTSNGEFIEAGAPQVWFARGPSAPAIGPFPARWHTLGAHARDGDRSPVTDLPGFYVADVALPSAGDWYCAAVADSGAARAAGVTTMTAVVRPPAAVGGRAVSVATPVATSASGLAAICTRTPPDPLHYISLDAALRAGRPVVACFATPLLCESRMCAPVLDEVVTVYESVGRTRAAFVHIEEYPQRDTARPAPAFTAWGFTTEPWTVVIDRTGIIRARWEGPVDAGEIMQALRPLL